MKKITALILAALVSAGCLWLYLRQREIPPVEVVQSTSRISATNLETVASIFTPSPPTVEVSTLLERPASIDADHWNRLMVVRQIQLSRNQPVEFYARVVDQNARPVEGVKLSVKLHRVDEKIFATTNFFHKQLGDEIVSKTNEIISDAQGWMQLKGETGFALDVIRLTKGGYASRYSDGYQRGVQYESGGRRNPSGDILMTNAWNPAKGYAFHLWKKDDTEMLIPFHFSVPVDLEDTNWYGVDLFHGVVPDGKTGDFRFCFFTTTDANGNPARRFRFEVPDGGLQPDDKPYPYEAPADGYAVGLDWVYEPFGQHAKGNPPDTLVRRFYVRGRNGKIYASVTWNFVASTISGYLNPSASRNLAPDPEKAITDSEEIRRLDATTRL